MLQELAIFAIAFMAAFFSSLCGVGASLVSLPCWLMLGFSLPAAFANNMVNAALWMPVAARNYLPKHRLDWRLVISMAVLGLIGAYAGLLVTVSVEQNLLKRIIGLLILFVVGFSFFKAELGITETAPSVRGRAAAMLALPLGFYEGFFGSGNAMFTSMVLCKTRGFSFSIALGYYYTMAFCWCFLGAVFFIVHGHLVLMLVLPAALGSITGGYFGSKIGNRIGARGIKVVFSITGALFGTKLLLGI